MVKSPCKFICTLENEVCIGCGRTREEISKWSKYTDEEKVKVLRRLSGVIPVSLDELKEVTGKTDSNDVINDLFEV